MRQALLLLILAVVLLPNFASAQVVVSPSSLSQIVYTGQPAQVEITIKNNFPFEITDLNFSKVQDITFQQFPSILANQSVSFNATVLSTSAYAKATSSTVSFFYASGISSGIITKNLSVTSTGFSTTNTTIVVGSTIVWKNDDSTTHSVTSTLWDNPLSPGSTFAYTFSTLGTYPYYDSFTGHSGFVNVVDASSITKVHNPDYDVSIPISLTSILIETNLSVSILNPQVYTIPYNANQQGVISVKNTGTKTARKIFFNGQWTTFSLQGFDVDPGAEKFVVFTIAPQILNSNDTGKNYSINFTLQSNNTLTNSQNILVDIPFFQDVVANSTAASDFFKEKKAFCDAYPTSPFCITEPIIQVQERVVYESPPVPYNFTQDDIKNMIANYNTMKDENSRLNNFIKDEVSHVKEDAANARATSDSTNSVVLDLKESNDQAQSRNTIIIVALVSLLVLGGTGFFLRNYIKKILKSQKIASSIRT